MFSKPALKGYLTVLPTEGGWLLHGGENELLRIRADDAHGPVFGVLIPLLDGRHTVAEIERAVAERELPPERVDGVLQQLAAAGILEEAGTPVLAREDADAFADQVLYFGRFTGAETGEALQARLRAATVDVVVSGRLGMLIARELLRSGIGRLRLLGEDPAALAETARALEAERASLPRTRVETVRTGRAVVPEPAAPDSLLVVALDRWDPALLGDVNARAVETRRPWLLVQAPGVREGTLGPLFVAGQTACWECLESRLASHLSFHAEYREFQAHLRAERDTSRPWGGIEPHAQVLAGLAALEVVKFVTGYSTPKVLGAFVTVDWLALRMQQHHVLRVPRCMGCRPPRVVKFPWDEAPVEAIEEEV